MKKETRILPIKNMVSPRCITGLFSVTEGITIEQHIIGQNMEMIKESLIDDELLVKELLFGWVIAVWRTFSVNSKK